MCQVVFATGLDHPLRSCIVFARENPDGLQPAGEFF
jgi:hypothetical protein